MEGKKMERSQARKRNTNHSAKTNIKERSAFPGLQNSLALPFSFHFPALSNRTPFIACFANPHAGDNRPKLRSIPTVTKRMLLPQYELAESDQQPNGALHIYK